MARLPRLNLPDIPQHVMQRGNNREACFFADQDYTVYLDKDIEDKDIEDTLEFEQFRECSR